LVSASAPSTDENDDALPTVSTAGDIYAPSQPQVVLPHVYQQGDVERAFLIPRLPVLPVVPIDLPGLDSESSEDSCTSDESDELPDLLDEHGRIYQSLSTLSFIVVDEQVTPAIETEEKKEVIKPITQLRKNASSSSSSVCDPEGWDTLTITRTTSF
jgi:hypothetical protein